MKSAGPVDRNVAFVSVQPRSALHATTGTDTTKLKESVEYGTIIADVVFTLLAHVGIHVVGCDLLEEVDVLVGVELCHFHLAGGFRALPSQ